MTAARDTAGTPRAPLHGLRGLALLALVALPAVLPACVAYTKKSLFAGDRDQVYVAYFDNKTFYRGLELDLTDRVVAEILSRPGVSVTSRDEADVLLSGRITKVRQRVLSENPDRLIDAENTQITVEVEILDARTGDVVITKTLTQRGEFVPSQGENLESAQLEAFRFLARDIVRLLEEDF